MARAAHATSCLPHASPPGVAAGAVVDFGLAVNVMQERPVTRLGTLDYMAPEVGHDPKNT